MAQLRVRSRWVDILRLLGRKPLETPHGNRRPRLHHHRNPIQSGRNRRHSRANPVCKSPRRLPAPQAEALLRKRPTSRKLHRAQLQLQLAEKLSWLNAIRLDMTTQYSLALPQILTWYEYCHNSPQMKIDTAPQSLIRMTEDVRIICWPLTNYKTSRVCGIIRKTVICRDLTP